MKHLKFFVTFFILLFFLSTKSIFAQDYENRKSYLVTPTTSFRLVYEKVNAKKTDCLSNLFGVDLEYAATGIGLYYDIGFRVGGNSNGFKPSPDPDDLDANWQGMLEVGAGWYFNTGKAVQFPIHLSFIAYNSDGICEEHFRINKKGLWFTGARIQTGIRYYPPFLKSAYPLDLKFSADTSLSYGVSLGISIPVNF